MHTVDYWGPAEFAGRRVVGGGTSALQLLDEIARVAAETRWVTRQPPASVVAATGLVWTE
ncbi:hypothetical protein [Salinispora mooreana]|uniref:hypothetical protein n=1 Tax=Salinispora mooreana TaxID=999545 RepID=UPI00036E409B|nr:hypothetical protein [Salinispora mooreana]